MSEPQYALVTIPYQKIDLDLLIEVDHPLKIPCECIQNEAFVRNEANQTNESFVNSSIMRLVSIAKRFAQDPDNLAKRITLTRPTVKDQIKGDYWPVSELGKEYDEDYVGNNVKIDPRNTAKFDSEKLSQMIEPMKGYLAKLAGIDKNEVVNYTRIEDYRFLEEATVSTKIRLLTSTDGRKQWKSDSGPFGHLVSDIIDTVPGFEPILPEKKVVTSEYPYSPEVQALVNLRSLKGRERIEYAIKVCNTLETQLIQNNNSRLDHIHTIAGSSRDMWDAAIQVLKTSNKSAIILSSFTNDFTLDHVTQKIQEAVESSDLKQLLISIGEPDRISGTEFVNKTQNYLSKLEKRLSSSVNIKSGISKKPNHVKLVISDSGWILFTTTNLMSSSPDNFILESGAIIEDITLSRKIMETIEIESWSSESILSALTLMSQDMSLIQKNKFDTKIIKKKLEQILFGLDSTNNRSAHFSLVGLEHILQKIAERPQYQIIVNEAHRHVLFDSTRRFNERLVLASDGLRESGLDLAVINEIKRKAKQIHSRTGWKPTVQIWWGRNAPNSILVSEQDARGRRQAKERLSHLRDSIYYNFDPRHSDEPMETHTKLILVDDLRLMITSDNILAFGDPEFYQGESGELGLLIDHPRITRMHRGQMELWLPTARYHKDLTRWGAAIADAIYHNSYTKHTPIPFSNAIIELITRIQEIPSIKQDWNSLFDRKSPEETINEIVKASWSNGNLTGLFHASGGGINQKHSINVDRTFTSLAGDSIWRKATKEEQKYIRQMKKKIQKAEIENIKKNPLSPEDFTETLFKEVKTPYQWQTFAKIYNRLKGKNYLYNLKLRKIDTEIFLNLCKEYLDTEIRNNRIWVRKRR
jgi:hypothetical protein